MKNMINERPFAFFPVAYTARWDFLKTPVALVIHNLKEVTSKSIVSSSSRQDLFEENLASLLVLLN